MEFKGEKKVAYIITAVLFIVGVVCYVAFPAKGPEEPVRIMFKSTAGKVRFTHKHHTSEEWYGFECTDCHHEYEGGEGEVPTACRECHYEDSEEIPTTSDAFHQQCIGCHEDMGTAPVDCSQCHVL